MSKQILDGETDLVELNNKSLALRGKTNDSRKRTKTATDSAVPGENSKRRKTTTNTEQIEQEEKSKAVENTGNGELSPYFNGKSPPKKSKDSPTSSPAHSTKDNPPSSLSSEDFGPWLKKIAMSQKTPFQKKVLVALCQVPRGKYTTYNAISNHLSSSPRAVGNALRNNPFAPDVPCHRVLATGGGLGGFGGSWGRKGEAGLNDDKKRKLLRDEGVKFDGNGKVVGSAWAGFT